MKSKREKWEYRETVESLKEQIGAKNKDQRRRLDLDVSDCALSSWATGHTLSLLRRKLELAENGWKATFLALEDLDGNPVRAKRIRTRYGWRWMLVDEAGRSLGKFAPYMPKRESTLAKYGLREVEVEMLAYAKLEGSGTGTGGAVWVEVFPTEDDPRFEKQEVNDEGRIDCNQRRGP
jgi:hypothetical protein